MKNLTLTTLAFTLTASVAAADTCNLESSLAADGKELKTTIGVAKRDHAYIESLGITLHKGLFGARYIETSDLLAVLAQNGCDASLMEWTKGRAKRAESGGSGGGSGGGGDDGDSGGSSGPGDIFD